MSTESFFISIIANYVYEKLKHFWTKCRQKFVPRKTMVFVPNTTYEIHQHWHNAELRGEPAMSIHSKWYATNLTNEPMWLLTAYLASPRTDAMMLLTKSPESDLFDRFSNFTWSSGRGYRGSLYSSQLFASRGEKL